MKLLKNKIFWGFVLSFIGAGAGYYLMKIYDCGYSVFCYNLFSHIAPSIFYPSIALALVFLILLFIPRAVRAWWKFAWWYVPIIAFLIITGKADTGGGGIGVVPSNIGPSFQESVIGAVAIYIIISLIIIAKVVLPGKKKNSTHS